MTTVLVISGSWPPQVCGVGDYAAMLSRELENHNISVIRFGGEKFASFYSSRIVREIEKIDCDLVHIQYPTAGYGRSMTPSALARTIQTKPVVVTLHEYSLFRWYRRPWFSPFAQNCVARIFTTDNERELFQRRFPTRKGFDSTIEIASNIPVAEQMKRQTGRVCYFGLIWPGKGVEEFIDLCAAAGSAGSDLTFELIGAIPEGHQQYADEILKRASASGVQISLGLPDERVADRLGCATYAYLPFPDGASAKRGTLAAAIVNGLIVVTRHSDITPDWVRWATLDAKKPRDALNKVLRLQNSSQLRLEMKSRIERAAARFRWDAIARRHLDLYAQLLGTYSNGVRDNVVRPPSRETNYESKLAS